MLSGSEPRLLKAFLAINLLLNGVIPTCECRSSSRLPLAGIFGFRGNNENKDENGPMPTNLSDRPPPPNRPPAPGMAYPTMGGPVRRPPPPNLSRGQVPRPPPGAVEAPRQDQKNDDKETPVNATETVEVAPANEARIEQGSDQKPPPPPPPRWGMGSSKEQMSLPPQQEWVDSAPPNQYGTWQAPYYDGQQPDGNNFYVQGELDASLARENDLLIQLDNMTAAVAIMEQREELHVRQLDVLTERVMDVEAQAANDRNLLVEYEANCTQLEIALLDTQKEIGKWSQQCSNLTQLLSEDQEKIASLKKQIREKQLEAEDLAVAIENVRLSEKRREAIESRKMQRRRGFFSWIFSFFISDNDDFDEMTREDAFDMAKSTLLKALQNERASVHELEAIVTSLQQNNSAISAMVSSRDSHIDELNSRVAAFEEDKVVLKAALRQLQKEIKEEAPKAQKLLDDIANANKEIKRLKAEMNGIIQTHQEEVLALKKTVSTKQQAISETESNLTAIGTYVDKLEERLTSFAVTRRDMEEREKQCNEIEEAAKKVRAEKEELEAKLGIQVKEQEELKVLLEELATERTNLQKDNRKLYTEREFRISEQEQLQEKCETLEQETKQLSEELYEWKAKCETLIPELEATQSKNEDLLEKLSNADNVRSELESTKAKGVSDEQELSNIREELLTLQEENKRLSSVVDVQTSKLMDYESKSKAMQEEALAQPKDERKVPFRTVRKQLSKATGMHGIITPSSTMLTKASKEKSAPKAPKGPPPRQRPVVKSSPELPSPPPRKGESS